LDGKFACSIYDKKFGLTANIRATFMQPALLALSHAATFRYRPAVTFPSYVQNITFIKRHFNQYFVNNNHRSLADKLLIITLGACV